MNGHTTYGISLETAALLAAVALLCPAANGAVLSEGLFEIEYSDGDERVARESMDTLLDALDEYAEHLSAGEEPIHLVICSTREEFYRYLGNLSRTSVTGVTRSRAGMIAVRAPYLTQGGDYYGTLRHELIHVLLARNTHPAYLPRWLDEGIAMMLSNEFRWASTFEVAEMYLQDELMTFGDLQRAFAFSLDDMEFGRAYAESLSLTKYLADRLGPEQFWGFVHDLKTQDFAAALQVRAGLTPEELWDAWKHSLWKIAVVFSIVSGFTLFQIMALLVVLGYLRKKHQGRKILRRWDAEEAEGPRHRIPALTVLDSQSARWDDDDDDPWEEGAPWEYDEEDERW